MSGSTIQSMDSSTPKAQHSTHGEHPTCTHHPGEVLESTIVFSLDVHSTSQSTPLDRQSANTGLGHLQEVIALMSSEVVACFTNRARRARVSNQRSTSVVILPRSKYSTAFYVQSKAYPLVHICGKQEAYPSHLCDHSKNPSPIASEQLFNLDGYTDQLCERPLPHEPHDNHVGLCSLNIVGSEYFAAQGFKNKGFHWRSHEPGLALPCPS